MASRTSIVVRLARLIQALPLRLFRFMEWPFVALFSSKDANTQAIFVLALPRSGSTVTYQAICHGLTVNYLSNLWNLFYQLPLLGGWLSSKKTQVYRSDFKSQHGFVSGLSGPAEGLRFWRWWLDCGLSDSDCETLPVDQRNRRASYLRRVLFVLARKRGVFATAYLGHTLVPDRLRQSFPGAVLIRLRRDPVSNALSLLNSMRTNSAGWFSILPHECESFESYDEYERVAAQVYWLNRRLDDAICSSQMLIVHYEKLCQSPESEITRIRQWCGDNGVSVETKFNLPAQFDYQVADIEVDGDSRKIRCALDRLEMEYGKLEYPE